MDLSQLPKLGKVAGVPGIALGVAVLLLGAVVEASGVLPDTWRGPVLLIIVLGAVLLGVLGLLTWSRSTSVGAQIARTKGDKSPAINLDKTKAKAGGSQRARTTGASSPASNVRE